MLLDVFIGLIIFVMLVIFYGLNKYYGHNFYSNIRPKLINLIFVIGLVSIFFIRNFESHIILIAFILCIVWLVITLPEDGYWKKVREEIEKEK